MLKYFAVLFFFAGISNIFSQSLSFVNKANMNFARSGSASATDGANEYIVNGFTASKPYTSEIEKYNYGNDSWLNFPTNVPTIAKTFANAEIVNNKLYIFNGKTGVDINNNRLEIIDLSTGILTYGAVNPFPVSNAGSAVSGNDIYFLEEIFLPTSVLCILRQCSNTIRFRTNGHSLLTSNANYRRSCE